MNLEKVAVRKQAGLILDSLFIILAFFVSYFLRKPFRDPPFEPLAPVFYYLWLLAVTLPFAWISVLVLGLDPENPKRRSFWDVFFRFCLGMLLALSLFFFVFGWQEVNRTLVIPFVILSAFFASMWRVSLQKWKRARGFYRKALIVGEGPKFEKLVGDILNERLTDFEPIGVLTDQTSAQQIHGLKVLGKLEDLYRTLHDEVVDEVIFGIEFSMMENYRTMLKVCETLGVNALIVITDQWPKFSRIDVGKVSNLPFVYLASTPVSEAGFWTKAILDRALAFVVLIVSLPILVTIGLLVKLTSRGPVFFIQDRTGLNGRKFRMYKFRTMKHDAAQQKHHLHDMNEMEGPVFKIKNDPRVTKVGAFLRKYSLDELPQFVNVLKGDMSLVGPRPLPCEEASQIQGAQRRRFSVKPGLTCIWQISGRNEISYQEWMELDLQYIDSWSLRLDFQILLKTPGAILSSKGAF